MVFGVLKMAEIIGETNNIIADEGIEFRIYPNPVVDMFSLRTNSHEAYSVEINSLSGQLLYSSKFIGNIQMSKSTPIIRVVSFKIYGVHFTTMDYRTL